MKTGFLAPCWLILALCRGVAAAAPGDLFPLAPGRLEVVPSFAACSYYFRPPDAAAREFRVEFRRAGEAGWERAFDPVSDTPAGIWKGSVFDLAEDTAWQLRVRTGDGREIIPPVDFKTWSSQPPIARVIDLSTVAGAERGLVISDQGTPVGWIKYAAPRGWRVERPATAGDRQTAAIELRQARYVILEGLTIVGGARHGVLVEESESVRILNCEISGWGRVGVQQFTNTGGRGKYADDKGELINYDAGVAITRSARTVVERCYVHDPRHRANSWMFSHPAGPTALYANSTRGGTVVRWNDFVGSDEHRWNDVIESSSNSAWDGGFFRDSDISGNFLAFGNDDGVELEGGGMNVRFYRNRIEGTLCGISTGACILGPQFVYGNLVANPGDEAGLSLMFFKNSHGAEQSGKRHFINNTLFGALCSPYGSYGKPGGTERIGYMRNNVFAGNAARAPGEWAKREDFDRDLFWVAGQPEVARDFLAEFRKFGQEQHGLVADPQFVRPEEGDFRLRGGSPARGQAAGVANLATAGENLGALGSDDSEVPFRPLALAAVPRQLEFNEPRQTARRQVFVNVPRSAPAAVPFAIRQNRAFTWFRVTPATGVIAPGESVILSVEVNPAALRGRPRFRGAFLVQTPAGLSRPVTVYAPGEFQEELRPKSAPHTVYLKASELPGLAKLVRQTEAPGVSGGTYVALRGGDGDPAIVTSFALPQSGGYSLLARVGIESSAGRRQNLALTLDDAPVVPRVSVNADYQWNHGATHFRVVYLHALGELAAGEHRLRLQPTGGALNLNELIITDRPAAFFIDEWQREAP